MKHGQSGHRWSFGILVIAMASAGGLAAQEDRPEGDGGAENQEVLADFGAGIRALGLVLEENDMDLRELWSVTNEAMETTTYPDGMQEYLEAYEAGQQQGDLEGFRDELKASVVNGTMSRDEALSTWLAVMDVRFFHEFKKESGEEWSGRLQDAAARGHLAAIAMRVPDAGDIRVLARPEFLLRDLQYFTRELELDEESRAIIRVLLEDYVEKYQAQSAALRASIRAMRDDVARRSRQDRLAVARSNLDRLASSVDLVEVRNRIEVDFSTNPRKEWLEQAVDRFEGSIGTIQDTVQRRHAELDQVEIDRPDTRQVLQMARQLQADRARMRAALVEGITLALDETRKQAFALLVDELVLAQSRIDARLGGMQIDLSEALARSHEDGSIDDRVHELLAATNKELLQLAMRWTAARIDREVAGLELFLAYEDDSGTSLEREARNHAQRARAELDAAVALRDRLLAGQLAIQALIAQTDPDTARRFNALAMEQGFAAQMRTRWCERAITVALECAELDQEGIDDLIAYQEAVLTRLEPLRAKAIRDRLIIEPRVARRKIDRMAGREGQQALGLEAWQEPGALQFLSMDDQADAMLESLLDGSTCSASMPRRRGEAPAASE